MSTPTTFDDLNPTMLTQPVPTEYVIRSYWHPNHLPCPVTGDPSPLPLYVPSDTAGWSGVTCSACQLQLGP